MIDPSLDSASNEIIESLVQCRNVFSDYSRMKIKENEEVDDDYVWLAARTEDLDVIIGLLTQKCLFRPIFVSVDHIPNLTDEQRTKCSAARLYPIVLQEEISDVRLTQRVFYNCVDGCCYLDRFLEGYGMADDAATVWYRKLEKITGKYDQNKENGNG